VVNIGAISTSFAIVRQGAMVFTYSMSIGGAAINRAIATDFGLTPQQAEEYKRVYGISGKSLGGKIGKATEPILNSILERLKNLLLSIRKNIRMIRLLGKLFFPEELQSFPELKYFLLIIRDRNSDRQSVESSCFTADAKESWITLPITPLPWD